MSDLVPSVASLVVSVWSIVLSWRTWSRQDAIAGRPLRWWHWRPRPRADLST